MIELAGQSVLVVGASEGIGLAVARAAAGFGADVTIAARRLDKLAEAAGASLNSVRLDASSDQELAAYFEASAPIDHLVVTTGGRVGPMPLLDTPISKLEDAFAGKFWAQLRVAKFGAEKVRRGGSIILTSGGASRRPSAGLAWLSALNAGLEAAGRALALELAPRGVRVNVVCPGVVDTAVWADMPADRRQAFLSAVASRLPVAHVGSVDEVALAYLFLIASTYSTGSVVDVDGGGQVLPAA